MCAWTFETHFIKRPTDFKKGHDGCKVSPPVWSILFGQNADLTSGHDCFVIIQTCAATFFFRKITYLMVLLESTQNSTLNGLSDNHFRGI